MERTAIITDIEAMSFETIGELKAKLKEQGVELENVDTTIFYDEESKSTTYTQQIEDDLDYKALLEKYMGDVLFGEGSDFLPSFDSSSDYTAEQVEALNSISNKNHDKCKLTKG